MLAHGHRQLRIRSAMKCSGKLKGECCTLSFEGFRKEPAFYTEEGVESVQLEIRDRAIERREERLK